MTQRIMLEEQYKSNGKTKFRRLRGCKKDKLGIKARLLTGARCCSQTSVGSDFSTNGPVDNNCSHRCHEVIMLNNTISTQIEKLIQYKDKVMVP